MSSTWTADDLVVRHSENVDRYKHNFLKQAVCELRFPTLMELGGARPPASFASHLRKEYPHMDTASEVTLGLGSGSTGASNAHIFRSAKLTWTVSLRQSSIAIETTSYSEYAQMKSRVLNVVEAASKIIDADFFTRVGLRYVNVIDEGADLSGGWINPDLNAPIRSGGFLGIQEFAGKLQLTAEDGGCLLQHGIRFKQHRPGEEIHPDYLLDIDVFRNEVRLEDTSSILDRIHTQVFDIFDWAIGPTARDHLSREKSSKNV